MYVLIGNERTSCTISATQLRKQLFEVLHRIEQNGEPVEIELKSSRFIISRSEPASRLEWIQPKHDAIDRSADALAGEGT